MMQIEINSPKVATYIAHNVDPLAVALLQLLHLDGIIDDGD